MAISGIGKIKDIIEDPYGSKITQTLLIQDATNPDTYLLCEIPPTTQLPKNPIGRRIQYESQEAPKADFVNPFFTRDRNKIGPETLPLLRLSKVEFQAEDKGSSLSRGLCGWLRSFLGRS
jgi:hypothetical protein